VKRRCWAHFSRMRREKPGFPLQVLGFAAANPVGFPLQSLAHGRQTVLRYQHGASPTACLYGLKANRDQPGCMGGRPFCATNTGLRPRPACTALKKIATSPLRGFPLQPPCCFYQQFRFRKNSRLSMASTGDISDVFSFWAHFCFVRLFQNPRSPWGARDCSGNPFGFSQKIAAKSPVFGAGAPKRRQNSELE
jgi:hypothetical protein